MKKRTIVGVVLIAVIALTASIMPQDAFAKNNKAKGYYGFPGNSLYGRSHNPHFMFKWGNERFESIDELVDYLRSYFQNRWEYRYSDRYDSEIEVATGYVTNLDEDSVTLNGSIDLNDEDEATVWFVYGESSFDMDKKTDEQNIDEDDDEDFSEKISGLDEDTRYYYRAVAEDEDGDKEYGVVRSFTTDDSDESNDDDPEVSTRSAQDITDDSAVLRGRVDMNDFDNGVIFFVYGTDEDDVEDVEDDYDTYNDIDEDDDNLQKVRVDADLDGTAEYEEEVDDLDDNRMYYYRIGVEYEDEDGDEVLLLGNVRDFRTD